MPVTTAMEIQHPRRILVLGKPDCDVARVLKALTGSSPQPDLTTGSFAGVTHEWNAKTAYYSAAVPVWVDEVADLEQWKAEFLKPEAKEVVEAVGAWIYCCSNPAKDGQAAEAVLSEDAEAVLRAVAEVVSQACGMDWDGTRLAIDTAPQNQGKPTDVAEEQCMDAGFEYIHLDAEGKNEYGEKLGLARAIEALEANEWSSTLGGDDDDDDDDDQEDGIGGLGVEHAQMNAELWGLKTSLLAPDPDDDDEDDEHARQLEGMDQMMSQLLAVRERGAGLPESERKRLAARAIDDIMKNF